MQDRFGRRIEYLRLSVTQACNLKCIYCMPDEKDRNTCSKPSLSPEEMERIVSVLAGLGIRKVRITGGEPLVRTDICDIIKHISSIPGIEDISLTTNGIRLAAMAPELAAAGLMRVNISLDSLKPEVFRHITGGGNILAVLKGIQMAVDSGMKPVKINTVLIKGENDAEIPDFFRLAESNPIDVRFIELMPVGSFGESNMDRIIPNSSIISAHPELQYMEDDCTGQPARYYKIEGYKGRIGFISPMSHKFCSSCNRIRLTCTGLLKPCLGSNGEVDVLDAMRRQPDMVESVLRKAIFEKPEGHNFNTGFTSKKRMNEIGG
jgi:cyclic pyranopterin phosphate synthase